MMTTETAPTLNACCECPKKKYGACYARYVSACERTHQASPCQPSIFCDSRTKFQQLASSENLPAFYLVDNGASINLAICHVHKHIMDGFNVPQLMREFVEAKDIRSQTFRHIT